MVIFSSFSFSQEVIFLDDMNGDNSISGLEARGWIVVDNDGGGDSPTWYQGQAFEFPALEGPDSGYVATDFEGANNDGIVDHWLISPPISYSIGDSLFFYMRSPSQDTSDTYDDSLTIMYSQNGSTDLGDFIFVGRLLSPTSGWKGYFAIFGYTGTIRFAFRYLMFDTADRSLYVGIDYVQVVSHSTPTQITLNNSYTFGDVSQSSSYRMIGLPGDINFSPTQLISGTHKTDWNMFYDNGANENYFEEYDGSTKFNFTPGRGFWVLSRNAININAEVNSVTLAGDDTYSISLHNGWNIISNPFNESVTLDDIKNVNVNLPTNATLWSFNGNFSQSTTLEPYGGYYFDNENNLASLKIPLFSIIIFPKANEQAYYLSQKNLTLKLSTKEFSSMVGIGFDPSSSSDYDEMDYKIPPGDFEELRINIVNNNLSISHKQLFIEHRPEVGEGQKFELQIKNNTNKKATLLAEGTEKFNEYEIYLVDETLKKFYNLKIVNEIEISQNNQSKEFSLLIGNRNFINTYKDNSVPAEFALYQNYPNPFNPSTFIRYQVPEKMHVSIKVFDVLGNHIKTLVDEVKNEGYYEVEWDAANQPSGVYFYKIKTSNYTKTRKMILLR